ncbi:unnamed protein product, partial [Prorocentrum cordatum]
MRGTGYAYSAYPAPPLRSPVVPRQSSPVPRPPQPVPAAPLAVRARSPLWPHSPLPAAAAGDVVPCVVESPARRSSPGRHLSPGRPLAYPAEPPRSPAGRPLAYAAEAPRSTAGRPLAYPADLAAGSAVLRERSRPASPGRGVVVHDPAAAADGAALAASLRLERQAREALELQVKTLMESQGHHGQRPIGGGADALDSEPLRGSREDLRRQLAREQGEKRPLREAVQVAYVADNSALRANTPGIQYRFGTHVDLRAASGNLLRWGATVKGTECVGGEWLKVEGSGYLPMRLNGVRVLKRKGAPGCSSCWAGLCGAPAGLPRSGAATRAPEAWQAGTNTSPDLPGLGANIGAEVCIIGATGLRPGGGAEIFCRCRVRGQKVDAAETARRRDPCPVWESGHRLGFEEIRGRRLDFEVCSSQAHAMGEKVSILGRATLSVGRDWLGASESFEVDLPLSRYLCGAGSLRVRLFGVRPVGVNALHETVKATAFEDLDANGDGRITREEFADAYQKGRVKFGKDGNLVSPCGSPRSQWPSSGQGSLYGGSTTASTVTWVLVRH